MLLAGVPSGWAGRLFADDSPEVPDIPFGIIALTDCSPFVIGAEKGFFRKHGIQPTLAKGRRRLNRPIAVGPDAGDSLDDGLSTMLRRRASPPGTR